MGSNTPAVPCCEPRVPTFSSASLGRLIDALRGRGWTGDAELIAELEHYVNRSSSDLISLPVALDELGEALDQSPGSDSYIDVTDGALWPAQLFDVGQGPDDFDAASDRWLLVVGLGSRFAYEVMQRFIATIDEPVLAARLAGSVAGSGAFRRFQSELSRHDDEYTRWHRFRDDARLGHARAWLADHGYQSTR